MSSGAIGLPPSRLVTNRGRWRADSGRRATDERGDGKREGEGKREGGLEARPMGAANLELEVPLGKQRTVRPVPAHARCLSVHDFGAVSVCWREMHIG